MRWRAPLLLAAIVTAFTALADAAEHPREVVIEWNQLLQSNIPATAGLTSFRYYSMMHIAMFDAVNSIEQDYERYHVKIWASPAASAEAAAAKAARDVLAELIPGATAAFDAALAARLETIQPWRAAHGVAVGEKVAQAVIDWRTGDGFELPNIPYEPPQIPGLWQPVGVQTAALVRFADVEPFGLLTPTQYLPQPPPFLDSAEYATDFEEVKSLGSATSATRSDEQTTAARLYAGVGYTPGPFAFWSTVARDVARGQGMSLLRTARLFALISAAQNDGLQTAHVSKYVYGLWRPITAIREAHSDENDATTADPTWTPLLGTPPYPSHASNLTCIAASAARALARSVGTNVLPLTVTWTGTGGNEDVTRQYGSFSELAEEAASSRVWGGIHFNFELAASHESCRKVADYIADNYMERQRSPFRH